MKTVAVDVLNPGLRDFLAKKWRLYLVLATCPCLSASVVPSSLLTHPEKFFTGDSTGLVPIVEFFRSLEDRFGLDALQTKLLALPIAFVSLLLLLVILDCLIWRFRMDPEDRTWSSLFWALRSWKALLVWSVPLLLAFAALTQGLFDISDTGVDVVMLVAAGYFLSMPFFVLNSSNHGTSRPKWVWLPAWPGWRPIVLAALLVGIAEGTFIGLEKMQSLDVLPAGLAQCISVTASLLLLWPTAYCLFIWLNRGKLSAFGRGEKGPLAYRTLAALFVLDLRSTILISVMVATALFIGSALVGVVIPHFERVMLQQPMPVPPLPMFFIHVLRWVYAYWWMVTLLLTMIAGPWFGFAKQARLFNLLGLSGSCTPR